MNELGTAILAIHVDDMPVTVSTPTVMANTKTALQKYFDIMDL